LLVVCVIDFAPVLSQSEGRSFIPTNQLVWN